MILLTHALGGAAAAAAARRGPLVALIAGIVSHFLLDMIPHWHYRLLSRNREATRPEDRIRVGDNAAFRRDLLWIATDCVLGFLLVWFTGYLGGSNLWVLTSGAVGGVLPDFLQFLYYLHPRGFLRSIQRFHKWIHAGHDLDDEPFLGIPAQAVIALLFVFIVLFLGI